MPGGHTAGAQQLFTMGARASKPVAEPAPQIVDLADQVAEPVVDAPPEAEAEQQQPADDEPSTSGEEQQPAVFDTAITERFRGKYQPIMPPSYEQMLSEDVMNNCAVKSVIAGAMGGALGVAFGIFTASLDTGVSAPHAPRCCPLGACWPRGLPVPGARQQQKALGGVPGAPAGGCGVCRACSAAHTAPAWGSMRAQRLPPAAPPPPPPNPCIHPWHTTPCRCRALMAPP